ncbi:MAG TPA: anti-sigma factor [Streptosporangiaceae bacterium]
MTGRAPEPHALIGAYAMDALDRAAAGRFERHLARCGECASELAGLRETTARLSAAAAVPPPARLRGRVLAASGHTAQRRAESRWPSPARGGGRSITVAAALVAAVAVIAVLVVVAIRPAGPAPGGPAAGRRAGLAIAAVLTAPDARMLDVRLRTRGRATVIMSARAAALIFTASGLAALPRARGYELWLVGPGRDRPAGMLPRPRHGMTAPVVAAGLRPGDRLGLTVEPSGGSGRPTSAMLLLVTL